ncbi:uncharacterized protein LOC121431662 [Lytechinus variegatus]|uniref:uncharacterized protein LOC121431662 n=1 Tax=Lytechinus variegatus TaxID=7654 RepID=UPI001BB2026A|nr:uncharacterized protein LOC121431662 [Lytechinus variegatus]
MKVECERGTANRGGVQHPQTNSLQKVLPMLPESMAMAVKQSNISFPVVTACVPAKCSFQMPTKEYWHYIWFQPILLPKGLTRFSFDVITTDIVQVLLHSKQRYPLNGVAFAIYYRFVIPKVQIFENGGQRFQVQGQAPCIRDRPCHSFWIDFDAGFYQIGLADSPAPFLSIRHPLHTPIDEITVFAKKASDWVFNLPCKY